MACQRPPGQTAGHDLAAKGMGMRVLARAFLWLHVMLYRLTNGRIGGRFLGGTSILLLTTIGRRTGKRRTRPLVYVRDGERLVLCASNGGSPRHPAWYLNLQRCLRAEDEPGDPARAADSGPPGKHDALTGFPACVTSEEAASI